MYDRGSPETWWRRYGIPLGLQNHHRWASGLSYLLGSGISEAFALRVGRMMAAHDVGNAVKFDLGNHADLLCEPARSYAYWREYVRVEQGRYGEDDHALTRIRLAEIGLPPGDCLVIGRKASALLHSVVRRGVPAEVVCLYSDMRIGPSGPVSLAERHREAVERYGEGRQGLGGTVTMSDLVHLEQHVLDLVGPIDTAVSVEVLEESYLALCRRLNV